MSIPIIGYPVFRPYENITPFTYRDGMTYLESLEALRTWIRDTLVPYLNTELEGVTEDFQAQVTALIGAVNAAIEELNETDNASEAALAQIQEIVAGFPDFDALVATVNAAAAAADQSATDAAASAASITDLIGEPNGIAALDENGLIPTDQIPKFIVSLSDYIVGDTATGKLFDISEVILAMEQNKGACYIPPGDWTPDEYNVGLDQAAVETPPTASSVNSLFRYKFYGAGARSRLRLPAEMGAGDYLLIANELASSLFMAHPKVVFEDFGVTGATAGHEGNFFKSIRRSFSAIRVYLAALRNGFYVEGYTDLVRIEQVYCEAMTAGGWAFKGVDNGDGISIDQLFVFGSNGISLRGAYGATIKNCVSGFHEFILSNLTLLDNHFEGDGSTATTPLVTFKGCVAKVIGGMYFTKKYRPTFRIDDDQSFMQSRIVFDSTVMIGARIDDSGSALGNLRTADIDVARLNNAGEVIFDHLTVSMFAQSTTKGGGSAGFGTDGRFAPMVISSATADIQTAINNGKVFLGDKATLARVVNAWSLAPSKPNDVVLNTRTLPATFMNPFVDTSAEDRMVGELTAGTYYYRAWVVDAAGRASDASSEGSATTTLADPIIRLTIQAFDSPVTLRVARGTSAGTYDRWVEVILSSPYQVLIDQGSALSGVAWVLASVTPVPAFTTGGGAGATRRGTKRLDNGQQTIYATAAPVSGTWAVGDEVINSAPAPSQPMGWVCTTAGTPGTWKAKSNLSA